MSIKNKVNFDSKTEDGAEVKLCVRRPDHKISREAQAVYSRTWRECTESGNFVLRERLKDILRKNEVWDDEKDKQYLDLKSKIAVSELTLKKGGGKLTEARELALDLAGYRFELQNLLAESQRYDENTAEAQAENARFDFLCSRCIVDPSKDGSPWFKSQEDYISRKSEQVAADGANELGKMIYGLDTDFQNKLPENQFLLKYGFVNEKLRLVNKDGHFVDRKGNLVDDNGRYINSDGKFINLGGELVDESGQVIVEFTEFEDDREAPSKITLDFGPVLTTKKKESLEEVRPVKEDISV